MASEMIEGREASAMLAGQAEEQEALFFVIANDAGRERSVLCSVSEARSVLESSSGVSGFIKQFSLKEARKA
jgi:hypothetical protein